MTVRVKTAHPTGPAPVHGIYRLLQQVALNPDAPVVARTVTTPADPVPSTALDTLNDQLAIIARLRRFTNLTRDQIDSLATTLDPAWVQSVSDEMLGAAIGGVLPVLPLHPGAGMPLGLPGAVQPTRYVGGTLTGPPTTGTFNVGDFAVTATGRILICTTAGSPGLWRDSGSGEGSVSVTFTQTTPAATWTVAHGLNRYPSVTVVVADELVDADVEFPDANTFVVVHGSPLAGRAVYS